jgi:hypothetical protein
MSTKEIQTSSVLSHLKEIEKKIGHLQDQKDLPEKRKMSLLLAQQKIRRKSKKIVMNIALLMRYLLKNNYKKKVQNKEILLKQ